jgi:peptidoglycan hydrolase CwlO-like protein
MAEGTEIPDAGRIGSKLLLSTLREIRSDQRETKELLGVLTKYAGEVEKRLTKRMEDVSKRIDETNKRFDEVKDDLEIVHKSELMGRLTHFETCIDEKIEELLAP